MIRLSGFDGNEQFYVYATLEKTIQETLKKNHNVITKIGNHCRLYPECHDFILSQEEADNLDTLCDQDVLRNDDDGRLYVAYSANNTDLEISLTNHCNSNCIMCPIPAGFRKNGTGPGRQELMQLIEYLPCDVSHITLTGGEPFLIGKFIFNILKKLRESHNSTNYLLLTNGRVFADRSYVTQFEESKPSNIILGIPIHGNNAKIHDYITQSAGSFNQTMIGLHHLLELGERIELRFVISRLNAKYITDMSRLIASELQGVESVKFMGIEMTGNAAENKSQVWIPYREAFAASKQGIDTLIDAGINCEIYNFPLCMVPREYWGICRKSITEYKIRYAPECSTCAVKESCDGFFGSSLALDKRVYPVKEASEEDMIC